MKNSFIQFLNHFAPINEDCENAIQNITVKRQLNKNEKLLVQGEVCREFHFIEKGLARVYYYKDGKEITAWFADQNQLVSAIDSLFTGNASIYNIEVIEDSVVWSLQFHHIEPVFEAFPIVERLGRLLVTQNYLLLDERMKSYVFSSAEERYEKLIEQIPDILNRAKLGIIASYIGVSQEHLSRMRASFRN